MQIHPYLTFNGNCEEAFKFYEQHLGGKINMMLTHAGTPMAKHGPPEWLEKILHASMDVAGTTVMGSDIPPQSYKQPAGFMISITVDSIEESERVYDLLKEGGHIEMALSETFWAERFAMLTDRFGTPWLINLDKRA